MTVNVKGILPEDELRAIIRHAEKTRPDCHTLDISVCADGYDLTYHIIPFDRIRRITGYLVGTVDRWNDAKRAELADRVKHA